MRTAFRRALVLSGATLFVGAAAALPAPAQQTTETTITYAAESDSAGLYLAITPPDEDPALEISGAAAEGSITSAPAAAGIASALAVGGESPVRAETSAPPDETDSAQSPIPEIEIEQLGLTVGALQGQATSASEAEDGLPSTENEGSFGGVGIDLASPELGPLGTVGGSVSIGEASTHASSGAADHTDVSAEAGTSGIVVGLDVNISLLEQVCENIPESPLRDVCESLAQEEGPVVLEVAAGTSEVSCAWNGEDADCDGFAAVATIDLLGQDAIEVAPGQTVTIPDEGPFLVRVSAGSFEKETDAGSASAVATGLSIELLGPDQESPGVITVALGRSTAAVSGEVTTERIIPRTGAPVLPLLAGGSALVAAGVALRRFLRR